MAGYTNCILEEVIMEKQGRKQNNWIVFAAAAATLLSLAAFAYAQENPNKGHMPNNGMMDMMGGTGMEQMHGQMTKSMDPELREKMATIHEQCEKSHDSGTFSEAMMQ